MSDQYQQTYSYDAPYISETTTTTTTNDSPIPDSRRKLLPVILLAVLGGLLLLIIIFFLLNSAKTGQNNNNNNNGTTSNIVLQWRGVFLSKETVQPLIDEYQAANKNVTIEYANLWPDNTNYTDAAKQYRSELNKLLKENDPVKIPDIFMIQNTWAGDYEKYTKTSTSYDAETFKNTFYPVVSNDFARDNQVHGIPLWIDTYVVIYNKELLAAKSVSEPPKNWPEFKALAQSLTKINDGKIVQGGFAAGTSSNVSYAAELANLLMIQSGVKMVNETGQPVFSADSQSLTALNFYKSFANTQNGTWDDTLKNDAAAFLEGKLAMTIAPSYRLRDILKYNELYQTNIDIGIAPIPQLEGQTQPIMNWGDYWGAMVALNRPNSTASWTFLQWITQPEQLKKLSENVKTKYQYFGLLYPRKDMAQASEVTSDQILRVYNDSLPYLQTWPMVKGIEVRTEFLNLVSQNNINSGQVSQTENNIQQLISNKGKLD